MKVFIGSSSSARSLDDIRKVAMWIEEEGHDPFPWTKTGLFPLGNYTAESLRDICKQVDAAILIFGEDDEVWYRNDYALKPRDNVVYEFGLFEGHLGCKKTIIVKRGNSKLPTDLFGITRCNLDKEYKAQDEIVQWLRFMNSNKI